MHRPASRHVVTTFALLLLAALSGCGGGDSQDEPKNGFEPITCSAQPSPCA